MASEIFHNCVAVLQKQQEKFALLAQDTNSSIIFREELLYASHAMMNNDYLLRCANANQMSLRTAFSQLAACGLTLNPTRQLCYLVPRDGQIILDVSWRGMIRLAALDGVVQDCLVELVYSEDVFKYRGKRTTPIHEFDPFLNKDKRGEFVGAYVEALLSDGRILVEAVSAEEIYAARAVSDLWKRKKSGPWKDFFSAMAKKSAIKIARKYWPQTDKSRLDNAIGYLNTTAGEGFTSNEVPLEAVEKFMGAAEVVESDLPVVEQGIVPAQQEQVVEIREEVVVHEQQVRAQAPAAESESPQPEPSAPSEPSEAEGGLRQKNLKKIDRVVQRATEQGAWAAARDYFGDWPAELREIALQKLNAARYQTEAQGC